MSWGLSGHPARAFDSASAGQIRCYTFNGNGVPNNDAARHNLFFLDYCRPVAERESSGLSGRVWRYGIADGFWAARDGHGVVEGDDDCGFVVHDHGPNSGHSGK